jgi:hypothetical protein
MAWRLCQLHRPGPIANTPLLQVSLSAPVTTLSRLSSVNKLPKSSRPPPVTLWAAKPSAHSPLKSPLPWSKSPRTLVWVPLPLVSVVLVSVSAWSSLLSSWLLPVTHPCVDSSSHMPFWDSLSSRLLVCST